MKTFDLYCCRCPRLVGHLEDVRSKHPDYHGRPVPAFGDPEARLLIVGLAPGLHGANASGRPFTGDFAGILLYQTLYDFGFSTAPVSVGADDGLRLKGCRITNAVKCLPPGNKPETAEIRNCNDFLRAELKAFPARGVVLALGGIAHNAVLRAFDMKLSSHRFGHGVVHALEGDRQLVSSYHCSRYNTQTRRLTNEMFQQVFAQVAQLLQNKPAASAQ